MTCSSSSRLQASFTFCFASGGVILGFLLGFMFLAVAYCIVATSKYEADASVTVNFTRQLTGECESTAMRLPPMRRAAMK